MQTKSITFTFKDLKISNFIETFESENSNIQTNKALKGERLFGASFVKHRASHQQKSTYLIHAFGSVVWKSYSYLLHSPAFVTNTLSTCQSPISSTVRTGFLLKENNDPMVNKQVFLTGLYSFLCNASWKNLFEIKAISLQRPFYSFS